MASASSVTINGTLASATDWIQGAVEVGRDYGNPTSRGGHCAATAFFCGNLTKEKLIMAGSSCHRRKLCRRRTVGATVKTVLQLNCPSNQRIKIQRLGIFSTAPVPRAVPVLVG